MNFLCGRLFKRRKLHLSKVDDDFDNGIIDDMGSQFLDDNYLNTDDLKDSNTDTSIVDTPMPDLFPTQPLFPLPELELEEHWKNDNDFSILDNVFQTAFQKIIQGSIQLQGDTSQVNIYLNIYYQKTKNEYSKGSRVIMDYGTYL